MLLALKVGGTVNTVHWRDKVSVKHELNYYFLLSYPILPPLPYRNVTVKVSALTMD